MLRRLRRALSQHLQFTRALETTVISTWLAVGPEDVFADLGCGDGTWAAILGRRAGLAMAVDMERPEDQIWNHSRLTFVQGNIEYLPIVTGAVSRIASISVMQHVDPVKMIAECSRLLKPGGRLALTVDSMPDILADDSYRMFHTSRYGIRQFIVLEDLRRSLEASGLRLLGHRWLVTSKWLSAIIQSCNRLHWNVNWLFPLTIPWVWLDFLLNGRNGPGLYLVAVAEKPKT